MGSVYSAGDGTDGALGMGGRESSEAFRLVEWWVWLSGAECGVRLHGQLVILFTAS